MKEKIEELGGQVTKLEEEVKGLGQKQTEIQARVTKEEDERKARNELGTIQKEIEARKLQIQQVREEIMSVNRATALEEVTGLAQKKKTFQEKIVETNQKGLQALEFFQRNIPKKKIQTSSAVFTRVKKQVESPGLPAFDIHGYPVPSLPKQYHTVEDIASGINLAAYFAAGWSLADGETVPPPEELTEENSKLVETLSIPDIFLDFTEVVPAPIYIPIPQPALGKKK